MPPGRAADLRPPAVAGGAGATAAIDAATTTSKVERRLRKAEDEEPSDVQLADHVVVNDDLETTIDEMLRIIDRQHETAGQHLPAGHAAMSRRIPTRRTMERAHDTMMNPPIEELLDRVDSKFGLVTLAARRARNINAYFNQLGEGLGHMVPPQVSSVARKPLSIGFEEIAADKIGWTERPSPRLEAEALDDELAEDAGDS